MKNFRIFLSENFHFLVVKFSVYLNRRVFVMDWVALYNVQCYGIIQIKDYRKISKPAVPFKPSLRKHTYSNI